MSNSKDIKSRISSVKNTKQITKAMKMVSAAKLRQAQNAITQAQAYAQEIESMTLDVLAHPKCSHSHPLLQEHKGSHAHVLVLASDRGLCGGFNANLLKQTRLFWQKCVKEGKRVSFSCVGKKSHEYIVALGGEVLFFEEDFYKDFSYAHVCALADHWAQKFSQEEIDELHVFYTHFHNPIEQKPLVKKLLPLSTQTKEEQSPASDTIYETQPQELLDALLPRNLRTQIFAALLHSLASEHGSRMVAMDNATKNADDMVEKLTLEFNKLRQAGITTELLEITSGAEALQA